VRLIEREIECVYEGKGVYGCAREGEIEWVLVHVGVGVCETERDGILLRNWGYLHAQAHHDMKCRIHLQITFGMTHTHTHEEQ
jgi:hypothetical protein